MGTESDSSGMDTESINSLSESDEQILDLRVQPPELRVDNLGTAVFHIAEIRQMILNFAIHEANGENILRRSIASLRRVQKPWLQTITDLFNKNGDPLYHLVLNQRNSLNTSTRVQQSGKSLDRFVEFLSSDSLLTPLYNRTFSLHLRPPFFRLENRHSLYNCLRLCGNLLLEVKMEIPLNGGSLPGMFPGVPSLGRLKKISVYFTKTTLPNLENRESAYAQDSNATLLIQPFLLGATTLTEFQLPYIEVLTEAPLCFQFLPLPITLTKIDINCKLVTSHIEFLASSNLPRLTELRFLIANLWYENDLLYRILDNFRLTLQSLHIFGLKNKPPIRNTYLYRFPVMENLNTCHISCIYTGLEADHPPVETYLPNLRNLTLRDLTVAAFKNWTQNSKLSSVRMLCVSLANENFPFTNRTNYILNLDHELMKRLHKAFPNVTHLEIITSATMTDTSGFKYLFTKMTKLITLALIVGGPTPNAGADNFWDALLIGSTVEFAAGLKASRQMWENVQISNAHDEMPSIRMLKNLRCLKLLDNFKWPLPRDTNRLLISDISFHYALLKMENLTTLTFQGRFRASDDMTRQLREKRKTLVYNPELIESSTPITY